MNAVWMLNVAFALSLSTFFSGCDHTRRIRQSATLEFSLASEDDLRLCKSVSIREAVSMEDVDKRREAINPGRFDSLYPWHGPVKIDEKHQATFTIDEVTIVSTGDKTPPRSQHPFSGKSFFVRVEGCEGDDPVFEIVFVQGEVRIKSKLSVKVKDVSKAVYLDVEAAK